MSSAGKFGILILAAGNSSRLGQPKQLLQFNGKSLIRHTADEAIKAAGKQVIVITGAHHHLITDALRKRQVHIITNPYWEEGMSSSIYSGLITLLNLYPQLDNLLISVSDQPFISAALFKRMQITQQKTQKGIVASSYASAIGVPVLFSYPYFEPLLDLKGHEGAKKLLLAHQEDMVTVPFPKGNIDIDTPADLKALFQPNNLTSQ